MLENKSAFWVLELKYNGNTEFLFICKSMEFLIKKHAIFLLEKRHLPCYFKLQFDVWAIKLC